MTAYEQGFITKCAEYGVSEDTAAKMLKSAVRYFGETGDYYTTPLLGAGAGALIGALSKSESRKERIRKALIGLVAGGAAGIGLERFGEVVRPSETIDVYNNVYNRS